MASASALRPQHPGAATACWHMQTQHGKYRRKARRQVDNKDYTREEDGNAEGESGSRRKVDQRRLFLATVNAKMEEGNIRAASRILCSQERPTEATFDSLAALQERHPTNGWMTQMEDLPKVTQTVSFQVSAREVEKAIRSFPAGSASGPDKLRPPGA